MFARVRLRAYACVCTQLAPNPLLATVYYGMIDAFFTMHTSGAWTNYLEVGAEDTATLNAVINSIASSSA